MDKTLRERLAVAYEELHRLAPHIYTEARVAAAKRAAEKQKDSELLYHVLSMENTVSRKQKGPRP